MRYRKTACFEALVLEPQMPGYEMGFAWKGEKLSDDSSSWLRIICSPQVIKRQFHILHLQVR